LDSTIAFTATVSFFGQGGNDQLYVNDLNDLPHGTGPDSYTITTANGAQLLRDSDGRQRAIKWADIEGLTLDASNVANTIDVTTAEIPVRVNGNGGSDVFNIADATSPVAINTGMGDLDSLTVNSDTGTGDAPVTVLIDQSDDVETLLI